METCHHCGTVLPQMSGARYCPNCGEMAAQGSETLSDPTQAFAAVGASGHSAPQSGMTWELPLQAQQDDPTQAIPAQGGPPEPEPDPYAHLYRPQGGEPPRPNATQVMAAVPEDFGRDGYDQSGPSGYGGQPAYDQPIDYQAAGGGAYTEPYERGYADDYAGDSGDGPRPNRGAKIGIGVAAAAVLVIVVSLITLGGGNSKPSAGPPVTPGSVTTPTQTATSSDQAVVANVPTASTPSSSASSPTQHTPGLLQFGDSGAEVKWLQTRLHQLGLYNGPINGSFDAATMAAVEAFQARTHPADSAGVVGRSTKTALIAAGSKPTLTPQLPGMPVIDKHHRSGSAADIRRLQQALAVALNTSLKATGQYDMNTFSAVVQYQSAHNLPADGIVNGQMWAALQAGKISG